MKGRTEAREQDTIHTQKIRISGNQENTPADFDKIKCIDEILTSEGNKSFNHYIEWLGLSQDPKLVVLSSIHHYYYDAEEIQNVRTVVNLKELNHIKKINSFLHSMFLILPPKCYLIGCFLDNKRQNGFSLIKKSAETDQNNKSDDVKNGIASRIPLLNSVFRFLDARTDNHLSVKTVSLLLVNNGFKVIDMTELGGLTYFCAQSQRIASN